MSAVIQRYHDISPVTLQLEGGAVSSSLYCGEVEGLSGGIVESFLVELYRCKLCQFTCSLKASISSHLLLKHCPLTLTYLEEADGGEETEDREEATIKREASPYQLDLNGQSKQSDDDKDFLLYNMLDDMSPPTCDISSEGGLQVAHTCEVSTLFVEENSIFPLKGGPVDLSCAIDPTTSQEEMAQSAHLMTLGLCRISTTKPPPASRSAHPPAEDPPPLSDSVKPRGTDSGQTTTPSGKRGLPCLLCPLTLPSRRLLNVHVQSHRAAGGFSCIHCSWTADSWEQLQPHWRSHCRRRWRRREDQTQDKTKMASRTFCSTARHKAHKQSRYGFHHHSSQSDRWRRLLIGQAGGKKEEDCTGRLVPSQTSRSQSGSMERRKKTRKINKEENEDKGTSFCCSLCHRKFSTKHTLRRHLGIHQGEKPFTCPHCSYSSRLKASLQQHLRTHTGEKPFRCAECPYASIDRSSLLRHSRTHSQEKPYKCQHCDYSSIQKNSLNLHARRHHTGEVFPCQQCEYSSPDRHLLLRHVRRHHAPPSMSHCGLTEKRRKKTRKMKKEENEDKGTSFCCSLCHRKFSTKHTLRRHLGIHQGEKPFTCPHCSYSSRLKASLQQHLRTHTGEKPFRCAECPYASIDRSSLLRHSRTHSQEKPYKCQHCDYSSIQKNSLNLHARRHHTGEVFPCQQCEYSSPDRHLLLRHVRRHHAPPSMSHCGLTGDGHADWTVGSSSVSTMSQTVNSFLQLKKRAR